MFACAACSSTDSRSEGRGDRRDAASSKTAAALDAPAAPYREGPLAASGGIAGRVELDGDAPADTVVHPTSDEQVCGASLVDRTVERSGDRLAGVVVWLTDVRTGKRLPVERRFEISNEECQLEPRVQAVVAGGTLNVRSADAITHRTRFVRAATGETVATVTENDEGQVVPVERVLSRPGALEVRCDVHPWTRGWIAVFAHPYFQVTDRDGSFALDSVPPGRYRVMAWHERLGTVEDSVTVAAGRLTNLTLKIHGK